MTVVVGTTLAAFVMDDPDTWGAWLRTAEDLRREHDIVGEEVRFFAAVQVDARGVAPFVPLLERLAELGGEWWTYMLDDGRTEVTTANRLRHLTMGQNLVTEYATSAGADHLLFMAADTMPPPDAVHRLREVGGGLVGGEVATYCFDGPDLPGFAFPVYRHMPTAAFVLIERAVFKRLRWRADAEAGMSDDPAYAFDAETLLGVVPMIRRDCVGRHFPESIGPIESRGHDMTVVR